MVMVNLDSFRWGMWNFLFRLVNRFYTHKFSNIMHKFLYDTYNAGIYKSPFLSGVQTILNKIGFLSSAETILK